MTSKLLALALALGAALFGCVGEKTDKATAAPGVGAEKPAAKEAKKTAADAGAAVAARPTWVVYTYDG